MGLHFLLGLHVLPVDRCAQLRDLDYVNLAVSM
jgi:hypothetical protein